MFLEDPQGSLTSLRFHMVAKYQSIQKMKVFSEDGIDFQNVSVPKLQGADNVVSSVLRLM